MYIDQNVAFLILGICIGYLLRGFQHAFAKRQHEKLMKREFEQIKAKAIAEKQFEARKLYPEQAANQSIQ